MMPPPPVITYSGASVCCTPTDDQDDEPSHLAKNSLTWAGGTSPDSPSDAMLGPPETGTGYTLQASSPNRSVTVTPLVLTELRLRLNIVVRISIREGNSLCRTTQTTRKNTVEVIG